ncbi:hypothetical protein SNE40_002818 [Patella caerulea]|uniref:Reverse transcriptase domain-containing protein n=1 Tax=Patella caerulea TaxID=87958 RepID=A0AAN8KCN3_PATCE
MLFMTSMNQVKIFNITGSNVIFAKNVFLRDRSFRVKVNDDFSDVKQINFSVPQGSINGPIYFICYTSTLASCIRHNPNLVGYADDHSLYDSFKAGDLDAELSIASQLSESLDDVKIWMLHNRLKMDDDKTEVITFGANRQLQKSTIHKLRVGDSIVKSSSRIKFLGMHMDENLNFKHHIAQKTRSAALAMFNLRKLRPFLSRELSLQIASSLVFSHMDYGNSLLCNLPASTVKPLQRIQNFTAKLILGVSYDHSSTAALNELHILPIEARCQFKLLVLVYKCINNIAPSYLTELLQFQTSSYNTRSSSQNMLLIPKTKYKTFADRSFSVMGPRLWNTLPESVKQCKTVTDFKKKLKTYFFRKTFI